jgi:hypothetical protein
MKEPGKMSEEATGQTGPDGLVSSQLPDSCMTTAIMMMMMTTISKEG